jgi:hypothetical protein
VSDDSIADRRKTWAAWFSFLRAHGLDEAAAQALEKELEQCLALEAVFWQLPIKHVAPGLRYESLIHYIPRQLLLIKGNRPSNRLPPKKGLDRLAKAAGQVLSVLDNLSPSALEALNYRGVAPLDLKKILWPLQLDAKTAGLKNSRSAPTKSQPRKIARAVAEHYSALTGKPPTVSLNQTSRTDNSPFVALLKAVYKILDIKAPAASQGRAIVNERRALAAKSPR